MGQPTNDKLTILCIPADLRLLIVSKVATASTQDYFNTIVSCKGLHFDYKNHAVAKSLNLTRFVKKPALANQHGLLLSTCLEHNNIDAYFVKGMLELFGSNNQTVGLHHMKVAADLGHLQGRYVYGVLQLAIGQPENGVDIINNLTDENGFSFLEDCMADFTRSVEPPQLHMREACENAIWNMWPDDDCHHQEGGDITVCSNCFHFYLLIEFFKMILGFNDLQE